MEDLLPKQNRLIMVVEDNPDDIFFIKRALSKAQVKNPTYFAKDGEEAISFLSEGDKKIPSIKKYSIPPILILLDLKLPRVSGFEFLSWLRSQKIPLKLTPVIVLTSSTQVDDINKAYELGANSYLVKPVNSYFLTEMMVNIKMYWLVLNEPPHLYLRIDNG